MMPIYEIEFTIKPNGKPVTIVRSVLADNIWEALKLAAEDPPEMPTANSTVGIKVSELQ